MNFYAVIVSLEKESYEHNVLIIERSWSSVFVLFFKYLGIKYNLKAICKWIQLQQRIIHHQLMLQEDTTSA